MKKIVICLLLAGSLLCLSQCGRNATIEYRLDSTEASGVSIEYQDVDGLFTAFSTSSPWSRSITLSYCDLPFVAFISVENTGAADVSVTILDTGKAVATDIASAAGGRVECCAFIDK